MRNLVKYAGIGLLVMGLAACDNNDTKASAESAAAESQASGQPISLMDGKLSFSLPADMTDQSGKLGTQANNMHVYSDPTGQKAGLLSSAIIPMKRCRCWRTACLSNSVAATRSFRSSPISLLSSKAIRCNSWTALSPRKARRRTLPSCWAKWITNC